MKLSNTLPALVLAVAGACSERGSEKAPNTTDSMVSDAVVRGIGDATRHTVKDAQFMEASIRDAGANDARVFADLGLVADEGLPDVLPEDAASDSRTVDSTTADSSLPDVLPDTQFDAAPDATPDVEPIDPCEGQIVQNEVCIDIFIPEGPATIDNPRRGLSQHLNGVGYRNGPFEACTDCGEGNRITVISGGGAGPDGQGCTEIFVENGLCLEWDIDGVAQVRSAVMRVCTQAGEAGHATTVHMPGCQ